MRGAVELTNVHNVVLVLQNRSLVVVNVQIIWSREDGHHAWETGCPGLTVHPIASVLSFVCTNDGKQIVFLQEGAGRRIREEVRTTSDVVVKEVVAGFLLTEVLERVCPEDIAHQTLCGGLPEPVNLVNHWLISRSDDGDDGKGSHF